MILADTSVWIDHLRRGVPSLERALEEGQILMHPFVLGELACGKIRNRDEVLRLLSDLPNAPAVTDTEALGFIERHALMGRGIGYVDVHLLASTTLDGAARLWTFDRRLAEVASGMRLSFEGRRQGR
jgi:hypothetical protein